MTNPGGDSTELPPQSSPATAPSPPASWAREATGSDRLALWLATGFGTGYLPAAPGTWGALLGLLVAIALAWLPWVAGVGITAGLILLGVPVCGRAAAWFGRHDPPQVVWDELATVPLVFVLCPFPLGPWWYVAAYWLLGFALHRLFDIAKPVPVRQLERFPGGWGVMLDDFAAAVYAAGALWLLRLAAALTLPWGGF